MKLKSVSPPSGTFKGNNFMTPNIIGFYKLRCGYAELSEGRGMQSQPIFGVTIAPDHEKRSKLFQSRREAEAYIEALS